MDLSRLLGPLLNGLRSIAGRGDMESAADIAGDVMRVKARFDEGDTHEAMPYPQHYGHASNPPPGCKPFAVFNGGDRAAGVVVAMGDVTWRIELQQGEAAIYDDLGQVVHLTRSGIRVETALRVDVVGDVVRIEGREVEIHATETLRYDVAGHGEHWFPDHKDAWTVGAAAGTPHPITPPEIV